MSEYFAWTVKHNCKKVNTLNNKPLWSELPAVWVGQLGRLGKVMEAVHARRGLSHGLAVEAAAIKVGQLLPVVLLVLFCVVVVGAHNVVQRFTVGLLWLRGPVHEQPENYQSCSFMEKIFWDLCRG